MGRKMNEGTKERKKEKRSSGTLTLEGAISETRPSRPIRCDVWIVERMRYPTNRPTDGHSQLQKCFVAPKKKA